ELAIFAMIIAVVIGINAGIISAWLQNSWFDYTAMVLALVGVSMPIFWLGLMGQWAFSIEIPLLPTTGREATRDPVTAVTHLYLPACPPSIKFVKSVITILLSISTVTTFATSAMVIIG